MKTYGQCVGWVISLFVLGACGGGKNGDSTGAEGAGGGLLIGQGGGSNQGSGNGNGQGGLGSTSGSSGAGASTGAGANGTSGSGHGSAVTGVIQVADGNACTNQTSDASVAELDLLIIEDKTGSMKDPTAAGPSKWTAITDALKGFVNDPKSAGIGAGIEFFGGDHACVVSSYETPSVPIAPLNGNAAAISNAIDATQVNGHTPTPAALEGGLHYAEAWASAHPTHKVVVVLATDGLPNRYPNARGTDCAGTADDGDPVAVQKTVDVARAGVSGTPSIPTYVVGVFAKSDTDSLNNLNTMAAAGNTGSAFIVDTSGNAEAQFVAAMNAIREANRTSCQLTVPAAPSGLWIDYSQVTVTYTPGGGAPVSLAWASSASSCPASGGFYYNDNTAPSTIYLCPSTCSTVQSDEAAVLKVNFGCMTPWDGGSTGAGGGYDRGEPSCLLDGQLCTDSSQCCSGQCNAAGYCGPIVN